MTLTDLSIVIKNNELPTHSNDNESDRYLALDLEGMSLDAEAFIHDLLTHLQSLDLFNNKIRIQVCIAVYSIVADLFATAEKDRQRYGYRSMATGSFTDTHVGHASFKSALRALEAAGMVEVIMGRRYGSGSLGERGIASRFRATAALHEMALGYGVTAVAWATHFRKKPRLRTTTNPILLRSASTNFKGHKIPGRALKFDRTLPHVQAMARQMNEINAFIALQDLDLAGYNHSYLLRIFGLGDREDYGWDQGGRAYSPGMDSYQQAPSAIRKRFLFNGEATVEVDIGSSFLTIYRVMSGVKFDGSHDPYDIPKLPRFVSKSWTVITFGHDKLHSRWPSETKAKYKKSFEEGAEGEWGTGNLQKDHPFSATQKLMLEALPELIDWPKSTIRWSDLQYAESCAVIEAVHTLATKYGVVAIPIHDSIRVPVSKQELAAKVLSAAFEKHVGVAPVLKTK